MDDLYVMCYNHDHDEPYYLHRLSDNSMIHLPITKLSRWNTMRVTVHNGKLYLLELTDNNIMSLYEITRTTCTLIDHITKTSNIFEDSHIWYGIEDLCYEQPHLISEEHECGEDTTIVSVDWSRMRLASVKTNPYITEQRLAGDRVAFIRCVEDSEDSRRYAIYAHINKTSDKIVVVDDTIILPHYVRHPKKYIITIESGWNTVHLTNGILYINTRRYCAMRANLSTRSISIYNGMERTAYTDYINNIQMYHRAGLSLGRLSLDLIESYYNGVKMYHLFMFNAVDETTYDLEYMDHAITTSEKIFLMPAPTALIGQK